MSRPDFLEALGPVVEALERLGVPYGVGGSVASSAYGRARSTLDVDVVADLGPEHVRAFVTALSAGYYVDEAMIRDAVSRHASFNLIHLGTMTKVDVFVLEDRAFDRSAFSRRREDTLEPGAGARRFWLTSPEDIVLHKLEWFRKGGGVSERQWADVVGVLQVQGPALDWDYLGRWARDLGVDDLLDRARAEADSTG